ncbi:MAG TPA: hypothetical protein VNR86_09190, partial [Sphingomicrobium sp.]|nr:hypothetical protein [Sphingomicrobium sp.]
MPVASPRSRHRRPEFLISCATIALAAATLAPSRAMAQAFQGVPATLNGTVSYARSTPGSETVTIGSSTATINWTPDSTQGTGNVNFLPSGNTATFQAAQGVTGFTVLNRVLPSTATQPIELNGTVLGKLADNTTGGNVWFYSPGGIIVGQNAVIDVGGLLLSTIDLPGSFTTSASGFSASFSKTQSTAGSIQIKPGAQINARSSYVGMVAPRIEQGGNVNVNGSAAYAAADQLTMTLNQGMFDIAVPVGSGTSDANGIVHTGTTGGAANVGASDHHSIYMVAVPKNQALTMLLDGSLGFAPAAQGASVENGHIVLRSGFGSTSGSGAITIGSQGPASFSSSVTGQSDGPMLVKATSGDTAFSKDLSLTNASALSGGITLLANNGHQITVGGSA